MSFPCFDEIVVVDLSFGFDSRSKDWMESSIDDTNSLLYTGFEGEQVSTENWFVVFRRVSPDLDHNSVHEDCIRNWGNRFCQRIRKTVFVGHSPSI